MKKVGIFLGRLQPQHAGHEHMIRQIFAENEEVILCVGSAQKITAGTPELVRNPLGAKERMETLQRFLQAEKFNKPYRVIPVEDMEPDSEWPRFLARKCGLSQWHKNTIYFADEISPDYQAGLRAVGFVIKQIPRIKFSHTTRFQTTHRVSSATEIRALENSSQQPL